MFHHLIIKLVKIFPSTEIKSININMFHAYQLL